MLRSIMAGLYMHWIHWYNFKPSEEQKNKNKNGEQTKRKKFINIRNDYKSLLCAINYPHKIII
jgi:hypothetical protein